MKKKLIIIAVLVISFVTSILCGSEQNDSGIDSIKLEEYTAVLENRVSLDSIAGTYNGVLPPDVKTTLTLNADGTYSLKKKYLNESDGCEVLSNVQKITSAENLRSRASDEIVPFREFIIKDDTSALL